MPARPRRDRVERLTGAVVLGAGVNAAALGLYWGAYRRHDPARLRASFATLFRWHGDGPAPDVEPSPLVAEAIDRVGSLDRWRAVL